MPRPHSSFVGDHLPADVWTGIRVMSRMLFPHFAAALSRRFWSRLFEAVDQSDTISRRVFTTERCTTTVGTSQHHLLNHGDLHQLLAWLLGAHSRPMSDERPLPSLTTAGALDGSPPVSVPVGIVACGAFRPVFCTPPLRLRMIWPSAVSTWSFWEFKNSIFPSITA